MLNEKVYIKFEILKAEENLNFCLLYPFLPFYSHPTSAQNVPFPVLPAPQPPPQVEPLPPIEEILPSPQPLIIPESPESFPDTITIQQFEVIGSTVFSQEELSNVLAPFTNRPISFTELLQAQQAITEFYLQRGYITSGAYIPPQTIKDGVVKIEVIEGTLEAIEINGLKRLNRDYVRTRIDIAADTPLNQNKLLNALQLLQLNPLISRLSAELSAGSRPGLSILTVTIQEAPAFSLALGFDNQRVASVGTDRRLLTITHNNLVGLGDRFNLQYYNTDGSNAIDDLSYSVPVNPYNGTVSFRYRLTDSEVIEEPFDVLDINSNYREYDLGFRQPILQTPNQDLSVGLNINQRESDTSILDNLFEGEARITTVRLFQEYIDRNNRQVIAARSQFGIGFEAFELDLNGDKSNKDFLDWRGQFQYFRLLTTDTVLLFRTDIQLSSQSLLPLEQFSLGGNLAFVAILKILFWQIMAFLLLWKCVILFFVFPNGKRLYN